MVLSPVVRTRKTIYIVTMDNVGRGPASVIRTWRFEYVTNSIHKKTKEDHEIIPGT